MAAAPPATTATDCSRATTRNEKLICTTPELRAADAAMAKAYSVLKAELPRAQRSALLSDQRGWLGLRDGIEISPTGAPVVESDRDLVARLLKETDERRGFLAGEGPNRAPDAPRLRPVFLQEFREGLYEINVAYPRIVKPRSPSERAFNKAARSIATHEEGFDAIQAQGPPLSTYDATYGVTYLDRRLAALVFTIQEGPGEAHRQEWSESLIFDFSRGRALTMADIIGSPAKAFPAIWRECKSRLKEMGPRKYNEDEVDLSPVPWPDDVVGDVGKADWALDKAGVEIMLPPPGPIAFYLPYECRLSWADLSPWLKPGGPLPPH
jgi:uncharacterized protein YecT (DUF1311 family)